MKNYRSVPYIVMIVPLVAIFGVFLLYPVAYTIYLSFFKYDPIHGVSYLFLENYKRIFSDRVFVSSIVRNFIYVGGVVTANFVIGFGFALLTYKRAKGIEPLRVVLILPMLTIPAGAAVTWCLLYDHDVGILNHFLEFIGLERQNWLTTGKLALPAVMITDFWAWTPFMYLVLLAGIQGIPYEMLEVAQIDGASPFQRVKYIILPMIKPIIGIVFTIKTVDTFRTFTYPWIMTRGGPGHATEVLSTLIYRRGFTLLHYGLSSAMAVVMIALALAMSTSFVIIFRKKAR